jgi:hypothetical protein
MSNVTRPKRETTNRASVDSNADSNAGMFDICHRAAMQARQLKNSGKRKAGQEILQSLHNCRLSSDQTCPRAQECKRQLNRFGAEELDNSPSIFARHQIVRPENGSYNLNGHVLHSGFMEDISASDQWGNAMWHQRISTDILHRYENDQMRVLLRMWQTRHLPSLDDFDKDTLAAAGILPWLHVFGATSENSSLCIHYAPKMISIAGKDYTGNCLQDHELSIFSELYDHLFRNLAHSGAPYYGISARRRRLSFGKSEAVMRRLELPLYDKGSFSGSLVYLQPER